MNKMKFLNKKTIIILVIIAAIGIFSYYFFKPVSGTYVMDIIPDVYNILPQGIAWNGKYLWVNDRVGKIYKIDLDKRKPIADFYHPRRGISNISRLGVVNSFEDLAWDGQYLWITVSSEDKIDKLDPLDGKILKSIDVEDFPQGLTFVGKNLWYSSGKTLYEINPETGEKLRSIDISNRKETLGWESPSGIAWDGKNLLIATNDAEDEFNANLQVYRVGTICKFELCRKPIF